MLDWSGSHLTASITWSRSMSMPMMRRASPMPKLKNTFTRMFWSPWPFTVNRFNRVVRKGWHKILGPLQKHCQLCENCDMIKTNEKNWNLVSADHNLNVLLQLDVGSLSIIVNGEELEVEDADDGGADRHGASAQTDWKDSKILETTKGFCVTIVARNHCLGYMIIY